jgi:hypothetical protein
MFQFNFLNFILFFFQFSNFQFSCLLHDMFNVTCFNYNYNSISFNFMFSAFIFLQQYLSYLRVEIGNTLFLIPTFC